MKIAAFTKTYGSRKVLDFPGGTFEAGKVYAVIGANGSGKSTFARILAGLERADGGVRVLTEPHTVGFMPQKSYAFRMSTRRNILLNGQDPERAQELMEALSLTELAKAKGAKLSGGETARMALARLLMRQYALTVFDEPTAAMDMGSTLKAEQLIRSCADAGSAVILITHSVSQAGRIADEILYFHEGVPAETGPAARVLKAPEKKETAEFLRFYGIS